MEEDAAAPPEHTDAALAAPGEPPAPAAPVLADAAPRRSGRAPKPKDRLDPGLEAKKPQWDTTQTERNRARAEARTAADDTPVEEHVADADEDESTPASPLAEAFDDEETLNTLRAKAGRSVTVEPDVRATSTAQSIEVEDDDRSISSAAFGIESSATSLSEPVDDDSGGVGRGPPTETAPPCDQAVAESSDDEETLEMLRAKAGRSVEPETQQRRALAEARNAFDQTRLATEETPCKFTIELLSPSTHLSLAQESWAEFHAYVKRHGGRWSVRRRVALDVDERPVLCSRGEEAYYVDLTFDPHAVAEAVSQLESAPEALRAAETLGRLAASAKAPSVLSGFPFQGPGGRAPPVAAVAPSATQAPAAPFAPLSAAPVAAAGNARSSGRRAAPRKRKNITTVLATVDTTNKKVAPFLSTLSTLVTSMPTEVGGWTDDGLSFLVNDELASRTVLPQYFSHTNFRSFCRQLACYGFRKTRKIGHWQSQGSEFQHALFQRDRPELLCQIRRLEHLSSSGGSRATGAGRPPPLISAEAPSVPFQGPTAPVPDEAVPPSTNAASSEGRAAPRKRKNITTVLANVDKTNTTVAPFLSKLSTLVTSMPTEVGGWTDDGLSFQVNEELASRTVLPQYFSHTNFRSFVRQLSCYGFRKSRKKLVDANGQNAVGWSEFQHALFQRDRPELLCQIRRMEHLPPSDPDRPAPKRRYRGDRSTVVPPDPARAPSAPSSKFWGVTWNKHDQRWQASYTDASGKGRYIGLFDTQEEAARAVDAAIRRAGLEGQRHTNSADANGPLVPKYSAAQYSATQP